MIDTNDAIILGPEIITESTVLANHAVEIRQGVIVAIHSADDPLPKDIPHFTFPSDHFLAPGLIDCHIHGAKGADVMDADPDALAVIAKALSEQGTTQFFATTMTDHPTRIEKALLSVANYQRANVPDAARIAGVHLEGPYLSPKRPGAQCEKHLAEPDWQQFCQWQKAAAGAIKLVTVAPELAGGLEFIQQCRAHGVVTSIGHTNATCSQAQVGIDAGATRATHLFNAMLGMHHRDPGAALALLMDQRVMAELIVDGVHLNSEIVQLAVKVKGVDKVMLVTDAMRAQCLGDGVFDLGGQTVTVKSGEARLANGVLAGSVLTLDQAMRNMQKNSDLALNDVINMASLNPAKSLGIADYYGSITVGKIADLILLNAAWDVVSVLLSGSEHERG